jgi:hypothetical protein
MKQKDNCEWVLPLRYILQGTAGLPSKNILKSPQSQLSWVYMPDEGLAAFEFCTH